jgi:hypothetical protein
VRQRIAELAVQNGLNRLITLTLDPSKLSPRTRTNPKATAAFIRRTWAEFRVSLWRKYRVAPRFIATLEMHPGHGKNHGVAHLHVLVDRFIEKAWIAHAWSSVGGGQVVDVRYVDIHRVARYVSKYVTKNNLVDVPDGIRRFTLSRGLVLWPKDRKPGWYLVRRSIGRLRHMFPEAGGEKYRLIEGRRILVAFFTADEVAVWDPPTVRECRKPNHPLPTNLNGERLSHELLCV